MPNNNLIIPRKLSGFMELLPQKQIIFDEMIAKIKSVFARNCFLPLDTPVLEYTNVLLAKSGGEIDKEVYHFTKGDNDLCMRYDLTVPLARFVAMNENILSFPFKRYQVGKVFRGERPQKGRFREFIQCDADIIGLDTLPLTADAECINLIAECFNALNLNYLIQISNRNILFGLVEGLGFADKTQEILTTLDKLDKIGKDAALEELQNMNLGKNAQKLIEIAQKRGNFAEILQEIENLSDNATFKKGIADLKELDLYLRAYNIPQERYTLNLGIVRGQNYYTGTIFETILPDHPEFGSVCAGGRYDNLAGYFTNKKLPGVGMSIGLTRLFDQLDNNNMLPQPSKSAVELEIIPLGNTLNDCLALSTYFRQNDVACHVNYDERSFKAKLSGAGKRNVPFVLIVGENEVASKTYTLRNMLEGSQALLSKEECLKTIKQQ